MLQQRKHNKAASQRGFAGTEAILVGGLTTPAVFRAAGADSACKIARRVLGMWLVLAMAASTVCAREKDALQYGAGLIVNVPLAEDEVAKAVEDVAGNGFIRGTKEYNKDEYVSGAVAATSSPLFPAWTEGGKIFYKVRLHALDPRNFKQSGDVGTLAVRYVVMGQGEKSTVLRIDAVFVEEFRHTSHPSNGSVESSEYKDIHDHLEAMDLIKQQTSEPEKKRQEQLNQKQQAVFGMDAAPAAAQTSLVAEKPAEAPASTQSLEQRIQDLRRQVVRIVKSPGAPLKSAPFRTAATLQPLNTGAEVLIVVSTPYWYGVETHDGQHGWIARDQLELLP